MESTIQPEISHFSDFYTEFLGACMYSAGKALVVGGISILLTSCASFEVIQDPRFGALSKEQLPKLIKSIRCELATFYSVNRKLRLALDDKRRQLARQGQKRIDLDTVLEWGHFDLDEEAYGSFSLDIKVQDQFGIPGTSTTGADVLSSSTGHSRTLTIGPNVQAQATYDDVLWFSIGQNAEIGLNDKIAQATLRNIAYEPNREKERLLCFRGVVADRYFDLEDGAFPELELFDRIRVNGVHTLAAWLQENSATMGVSRNILVDAHAKSEKRPTVPVDPVYTNQAIDGGQLNYTFTVQYTGGLDAKFSLVSPRLNPLAADLSASIQQTGVLSLFLNGYQAAAAIGAKSNLTFIVPPEPKPTSVIIVGDNRPKGHVSPEGQQKISDLLAPPGTLKPESEGGPPPANLSNFFSELSKDQLTPGQAQTTRDALSKLKLPNEVRRQVETTINNSLVVTPPAPRVVIPSGVQAGAPNTNGRGTFRYPPAFPAPN
jgi:hypothetical protein